MLTDSRVMGEMLVCKAVRRGDIWVTWAGLCSAAGVHIVVLSQQMSRIVLRLHLRENIGQFLCFSLPSD